MGKITKFPAATNLANRESLTIELPGFLLRALEHRVNEANEDASEAERVDLNHPIEIQLAEFLTIADVAHLERNLPGMSAAVSRWLGEIE
jgi:hypothetical protein